MGWAPKALAPVGRPSERAPLGPSPQALSGPERERLRAQRARVRGPARERVRAQPATRLGPRTRARSGLRSPARITRTTRHQATFGSGLENSAGGARHQQGGWQRLLQGTSVYPISMDPPNQAHRAPSDSSSRQGHPTIYPPPPQAVFPIPRGSNTENSSRTSFSGSKRKRAVVDDSSDAGRSRTRVSSMSDFNNNTKAQVREQYNNKCWHCGASPADLCHVIGSRDNTVSRG